MIRMLQLLSFSAVGNVVVALIRLQISELSREERLLFFRSLRFGILWFWLGFKIHYSGSTKKSVRINLPFEESCSSSALLMFISQLDALYI